MKKEMDDGFKELMQRELAVPSYIKAFRMSKYLTVKYYNGKIIKFAERMLKEMRFRRVFDFIRDDDIGLPLTKLSLDFALKTNKINETYRQRMHGLFEGCISDKNVIDIVSQYCDNGYKWFRLEFVEPSKQCKVECMDLNQEIIWDLVYDDDDYFRNNKHYKAQIPAKDKAVSFSDWRHELDAKIYEKHERC